MKTAESSGVSFLVVAAEHRDSKVRCLRQQLVAAVLVDDVQRICGQIHDLGSVVAVSLKQDQLCFASLGKAGKKDWRR